MKTISIKEYDPSKHIKEFKRKCNQCGKVWHVLESREKKLRGDVIFNAAQQTLTCCNPSASLQAKRNVEANETELHKLKRCPECNSSDYSGTIVIYAKK
ncbi:hypothetical protein J4219_05610 [Candidatus Woesearchaeota archaeon]|nr:hypothetical protein [Candidatus Woesearchaeota archaeon]